MADSAIRRRMVDDKAGTLADEFTRHRDRLWKLIRFRLDPALAGRVGPDDVLQDAWLAAFQRVDHFLQNETYSMFVWLRLVALQTLADVQRRHVGAQMRNAYRETPFIGRSAAGTSISLTVHLLGRAASPSSIAVREESSRRLQEAIDAMDPLDREVLALRHFEELTNSEVAETLNIQQKAASIRYVRALQRLKKILGALPEFSERLK